MNRAAAPVPRRLAALAASALCAFAVARGDEDAILRELRAYFAQQAPAERSAIVGRIERDPVYDRGRLSAWLHQAVAFPELPSGRSSIMAALPNGAQREILIRVPRAYDARRPWPLVYALHGQGGAAAQIMAYVEQLLGERVEEFLVAAPQAYEEVVIHHAHWPPIGEHPALLSALRRQLHLDSDRVYALGYSRGGHTSWTLAILHADELAGAVPLAGTFLMAEVDRLWEHMLPNLRNTRVLCVWGAQDALDDAGQPSRDGGIAGLNRKLRDACAALNAPAILIELPGVGHGGVNPPTVELTKVLARKRPHYPQAVRIAFRDISQARCAWLEGHDWVGPQWTAEPPTLSFQPSESPDNPKDVRAAFTRAFAARLGELRGEVKGQELTVRRKGVGDLTVWLSDELIDLSKPLRLTVSGRKVFEGVLAPSLAICLQEAARTFDFDRLRWAGLNFDAGGKTKPVDAATPRRRP